MPKGLGTEPGWPAFARRSGLRPSDDGVALRQTKSADTVRQDRAGGLASLRLTMYYVYILHCNDSHPYVGCTDNLKDRLARHQIGNVPATVKRLPAKLICYTSFANKYKAYEFEKYLKSGSGRAFLKRRLL